MKAIQQANASLIGFGKETILDADEPAFSNNVNYLFGTTVSLLAGGADKPPYILERSVRITRVLSYAVRWIAAFAPVGREQPHMRQVWKWMGQVALVMLGAGAVGWMLGSNHDVVGTISAALYGVIVVFALVALGCVLGFRWGFAAVIATVAGACIGAGAVVWWSPVLRDQTVLVWIWDVRLLLAIPAAGVIALIPLALLTRALSRVRNVR
jgi:hypothetical protein